MKRIIFACIFVCAFFLSVNAQTPEVNYFGSARSKEYVIKVRFGGDEAIFSRLCNAPTTEQLAKELGVSRENLINLAARAYVHNPNGSFNTALFKLLDPCEEGTVEITDAHKALVYKTLDWALRQDFWDRQSSIFTQNFAQADGCIPEIVDTLGTVKCVVVIEPDTIDLRADVHIPPVKLPSDCPECGCFESEVRLMTDAQFNELARGKTFASIEEYNDWLTRGIYLADGRPSQGSSYQRASKKITENHIPANGTWSFKSWEEWRTYLNTYDMRYDPVTKTLYELQ